MVIEFSTQLSRSWKVRQLLVLLVTAVFLVSCAKDDWRTADRSSAGLAPDPAMTQEAVIQAYAADAWSWRGWFAVHTWIAAKRTGENHYRVYDVIGWRHNGPVMKVYQDVPDRHWFGSKPALLLDRRGEGVDALIDAIDKAAAEYPWKQEYTVFPGPNSNTFIGWIALRVPQLKLELPFSAIGSGYAERELD